MAAYYDDAVAVPQGSPQGIQFVRGLANVAVTDDYYRLQSDITDLVLTLNVILPLRPPPEECRI
jgi:hypothetical protein